MEEQEILLNHCASLSLALLIINGEKLSVPFGILSLSCYLYLLDNSSVLVSVGYTKRYRQSQLISFRALRQYSEHILVDHN